MANILIGIPTTGTVRTACMGSIVSAALHLQGAGHRVSISHSIDSDLVFQRNVLASQALEKGFTHLLSVDSDMSFAGTLPVRMLNMDKAVIGAFYPSKNIDLNKVVTLARAAQEMPTSQIIARSQNYMPSFHPGWTLQDGAYKTGSIGMGIALIRCDTFAAMIASKSVRARVDRRSQGAGLDHGVYGFFDRIDGVGEDVSFCRRWSVDCGEEIWAIADADVGHIGDMRYGQPFSAGI